VKTKFFVILLCLCSLVGIVFFLVQRNWLIVQFTYAPSIAHQQAQQSLTSKKSVKIFYWKKGSWHHEEASIVWDDQNLTQTLQQLVKQWLTTMVDEQLIPQNCTLESIALSSPGSEVYLSFDRSFLIPELSIIKKWYVIEGLFKTIHHAGMTINSMMFLVNNQPMIDDHIEFSQPIPAQQRLR
jgi:hypothetical protein